MIDWESIPIHLRCTCREKIDPRYPGGARWWKQQDLHARAGVSPEERSAHKDVPCRSKYLPVLLKTLDGREANSRELADILGISTAAVPAVVGGLSFGVPVYESKRLNETWFGILEATA